MKKDVIPRRKIKCFARLQVDLSRRNSNDEVTREKIRFYSGQESVTGATSSTNGVLCDRERTSGTLQQRSDRKRYTLLLLQSDRYSRIAIPGGSRERLLIEPLGGEILARKLSAETR